MNTSPPEQLINQPGFPGGAEAEQSRQQAGLPGLSLVKTGSVNAARTMKRLFPVLALCAGTACGADLAEQNKPEQIEHAGTTQAMAGSSTSPHSVETEEWRLKAEQAQRQTEEAQMERQRAEAERLQAEMARQQAEAARKKAEEELRHAVTEEKKVEEGRSQTAAEIQRKADELKAECGYHLAKAALLRTKAQHLQTAAKRKVAELKLMKAQNEDERKRAEAELVQIIEEELMSAERVRSTPIDEEAKQPSEEVVDGRWYESRALSLAKEVTELKAEMETRQRDEAALAGARLLVAEALQPAKAENQWTEVVHRLSAAALRLEEVENRRSEEVIRLIAETLRLREEAVHQLHHPSEQADLHKEYRSDLERLAKQLNNIKMSRKETDKYLSIYGTTAYGYLRGRLAGNRRLYRQEASLLVAEADYQEAVATRKMAEAELPNNQKADSYRKDFELTEEALKWNVLKQADEAELLRRAEY